jgi:hypothetical protein
MKNTLFLALAAGLFITSCKKSDAIDDKGTAQIIASSSVPAAVLTTFNTQFSGATEVEWQREDNTHFRSQFNHNSSRNEARFDDSGHHLSTTQQCSSAVPAVVLNAFRAQFPNDSVYEWKLNNDGTWKPHFMRGTVKWEVTISATGTIIKVEHD